MVLLQADWVLPISGPAIPRGAVIVKGGRVVEVGYAAQLRQEQWVERVLEYPGCALMPGLVNTHTHLEYSAFRGLLEPSGFGRWMLGLLRARRKLGLADYEASALWGAYDCVRNGITSIADTTYEGAIVGNAARAAGLRALVYAEVFGLDDAQLPSALARLEERVEKLRAVCGPELNAREDDDPAEELPCLVEPGISPHAPYTVSSRLYHEVARMARRAGLRMVTHLAESQAEVDLLGGKKSAIVKAYQAANLWTGQSWVPPGLRPVEYLERTGALGPDMLAVHAVHVDAVDIARLAATRTGVAHCPRSNLRLQCGMAPAVEMLAAGVAVGLGTDSLASNDSHDMFSEMRAALVVSRARAAAGAPHPPLTAEGVLRMATITGARALGRENLIGSLDRDKRADLIAVRIPEDLTAAARDSSSRDVDETESLPDVAARLVEEANAGDVRMTMVDGRIVFDADRSPGMPPEAAEGIKIARRKLGLGG
jgi:aminodeoxyfutalosine deaminase